MTKSLINKDLRNIEKLINNEYIEREYVISRLSELLNHITYLFTKYAISRAVYNDMFNKILELVEILNLKKPEIKTLGN